MSKHRLTKNQRRMAKFERRQMRTSQINETGKGLDQTARSTPVAQSGRSRNRR